MILRVFSVYDSKAEAYMQPLFFQTKGLAIRSFSEAANDGKSTISLYPADYTLFELGSYDSDNAKFDLHSTPISVGVAIEFVKDAT